MKKLKLFIGACLLLPLHLMAQDEGVSESRYVKSGFFSPEKEQVFYGGFTAGGNFTTVAGDSYGGYKKAGFVGGITVYTRILPKMLANVEILYSMKGARGVAQLTSIYSGEFFERYFLNLNYVEIPAMLHYNITSRWHIGLGGAYSQLIGLPVEEVVSDQPKPSNPEGFKKTDINFVAGAGLQIGNGWFLMLRYQRSIQSIRDAAEIPYWQNSPAQFNDLFSLRLMYLID